MDIVKKLRSVATYLNDDADEIEDAILTPDDWCNYKMGLEIIQTEISSIMEEMKKHYD